MVTGLAYVLAYPHDPSVRPDPAAPQWWAWTDQGRYLRAARAWAAGDLTPQRHWYPAGYPLLGASFVDLIPSNPFYLVDLVCLLATGALTVDLGRRLAPESAWSRPAAAVAFCLAVPLNTLQLRSYLQPWTSTPTVPLTLGALVLALALWDRPNPARAAATGLALGTIVLFRPTDAVPPALMIGLTSLGLLRLRPWLAMAGGSAVPVAAAALLHLAVFGSTPGDYLTSAAATGFEWRLLPYRWVSVMVSAAPDWPGLVSLAHAFPVFITGAAGTVACLVATTGRARRAHLAVGGAVWLHVGLFLCYRDLHAQGLFRFGNYHYFKVCVPVLALYTWLLVGVVAPTRRRWRAWGVGAAAAAAAFAWRVSWTPGPPVPTVLEGDALQIASLPAGVGTALYVPAMGDELTMLLGDQWLDAGGRRLPGNETFKLVPWREGFLLMPLRPLPAGPAILHMADGIRVLGPATAAQARYFLRAPDLPRLVAKLGHFWR